MSSDAIKDSCAIHHCLSGDTSLKHLCPSVPVAASLIFSTTSLPVLNPSSQQSNQGISQSCSLSLSPHHPHSRAPYPHQPPSSFTITISPTFSPPSRFHTTPSPPRVPAAAYRDPPAALTWLANSSTSIFEMNSPGTTTRPR